MDVKEWELDLNVHISLKLGRILCKIVPSFTKMCTLRLELPVLEVQRGPPHDLTKTVEFDKDLGLILEGFETALQNSFLVPHSMLSVQSSREN